MLVLVLMLMLTVQLCGFYSKTRRDGLSCDEVAWREFGTRYSGVHTLRSKKKHIRIHWGQRRFNLLGFERSERKIPHAPHVPESTEITRRIKTGGQTRCYLCFLTKSVESTVLIGRECESRCLVLSDRTHDHTSRRMTTFFARHTTSCVICRSLWFYDSTFFKWTR